MERTIKSIQKSKQIMKQLFTILIASVILFSCKDKKSTKPPFIGTKNERVAAIWIRPDSLKEFGIMLRVISRGVRYDSINHTESISADTMFGYPVQVPLLDSLGRPVLDSVTKKQIASPTPQYILIHNDSVNWKVEGVSIDSLLKK